MNRRPDMLDVAEPFQSAPERLSSLPHTLASFPILRSAVEEFVGVERNRPQLQHRFAALVDRFIDQASVEDRRYAAMLLAPRQDAPRSIILKLAHDEISVATPVLKSSPLLAEADLQALIACGNSAVTGVIASRADLTRPLIQTMLDQNDTSAVSILYANKAAPLIPDMVASVVAEPDNFPERADLLAQRNDTDAEALARLYLHLDPEQRERARVICQARAALEAMLPGAMAVEKTKTEDEPQIDLHELEGYAVSQQIGEFVQALSDAAGLTTAQVRQILNDQEGSALVILLARLGIDQPAMVRLLLFVAPHLGTDFSALKRVSELRFKITDQTAQFIVRQWARDSWGRDDADRALPSHGTSEIAVQRSAALQSAASRPIARPIPRHETARVLADPQPRQEGGSTAASAAPRAGLRRMPIFGRRRG